MKKFLPFTLLLMIMFSCQDEHTKITKKLEQTVTTYFKATYKDSLTLDTIKVLKFDTLTERDLGNMELYSFMNKIELQKNYMKALLASAQSNADMYQLVGGMDASLSSIYKKDGMEKLNLANEQRESLKAMIKSLDSLQLAINKMDSTTFRLYRVKCLIVSSGKNLLVNRDTLYTKINKDFKIEKSF